MRAGEIRHAVITLDIFRHMIAGAIFRRHVADAAATRYQILPRLRRCYASAIISLPFDFRHCHDVFRRFCCAAAAAPRLRCRQPDAAAHARAMRCERRGAKERYALILPMMTLFAVFAAVAHAAAADDLRRHVFRFAIRHR